MTTGAVIGRTIAESTPAFEPRARPPAGAPHVVVVVLDDLGFGQLGCFGSDIATPHIDRLADEGLRFNRFHVTSLCSPTRAALLTGRNHHAVGMGFLTDIPTGFPGYTGRIPRSAAALPRILRDVGYSTFAVGKWHLAPRWEQSVSGPFDRWPLGLGFERFYGFLGGDTNQWTPDLVADNGFVDPPRRPEDGYHLTEDLADRAARFVLDQQQATPGKPFFLYFAPGAMHAPHHVATQWSDPYRGRFDNGWEAWREELFDRQVSSGVVPAGTQLTPRPPWVDDWSGLADGERRLFARMMEVFAGFLTHTDAQIGRLLSFLSDIGVLEETLLVLISDNGTSAEGGPAGSFNEHRFTHDMEDDLEDTLLRIDDLGGSRAYNHYPWGWAWAGNTPFRLWKRYTWLGGVRTPMIVRWPGGIPTSEQGAVRSQFCHTVDVMPTVLDAVGVGVPALVDGVQQQPVDGGSLRCVFETGDAPSPRRTQYFEMLGSRAIYHDGWKATTDHVGPQISVERRRMTGSHRYDDDHWALFDLGSDFSESTDLAADRPEVVAQLEQLWWAEAGRNHVLPLEDSFIARAVAMEHSPVAHYRRTVYRRSGGGVAEDFLPPIGGGFVMRASVEVPPGGCEGVLCALGDWSNGFAWYVVDGCVRFTVNLFSRAHTAAASAPLDPGSHELTVNYQREHRGGGPLAIAVDGSEVASVVLPSDMPFRWQIGGAGLLVGRDTGFPVDESYYPPSPFTGGLDEITIEIPSLAPRDVEAEVEQLLKHE